MGHDNAVVASVRSWPTSHNEFWSTCPMISEFSRVPVQFLGRKSPPVAGKVSRVPIVTNVMRNNRSNLHDPNSTSRSCVPVLFEIHYNSPPTKSRCPPPPTGSAIIPIFPQHCGQVRGHDSRPSDHRSHHRRVACGATPSATGTIHIADSGPLGHRRSNVLVGRRTDQLGPLVAAI